MKKGYLYYLPVVLSLLISFFVYKDYGIAWDEPYQRELGLQAWQYIFEHDQYPLDEYKEDFGIAYELVLIGAEKLFSLEDPKEIYEMRHLFSHLIFLLGAFFFLKLGFRLFKNKIYSLAAYCFLLMMPALYAHSFFNSKDLPFLSLLLICLFLAEESTRKKNLLLLILSGIIAGIMVNIRIMGLLPVVMLVVYIPLAMHLSGSNKWTILKYSLLFLLAFLFIFYLLWPYLWGEPIERFLLFLHKTSQVPWPGKVLFFGEYYSATEIPQNYLPVWIGISTPIALILLLITGNVILIRSIVIQKLKFFKEQTNLFILFSFFLIWIPILAVFAMNAVLYDSWRHLYFIFPFMIVIGIYGFQEILILLKNKKFFQKIIWSILVLTGVFQLAFMIQTHPNQQVYMNLLVPRKGEYIRMNFDQDYWGTSFKQAFEHIAKTDNSDSIVVVVTIPPGEFNLQMLPQKDRSRFFFTIDFTKADYFLTNYREANGDFGLGEPWWSIEINKSKIMSVWNFKKNRNN